MNRAKLNELVKFLTAKEYIRWTPERVEWAGVFLSRIPYHLNSVGVKAENVMDKNGYIVGTRLVASDNPSGAADLVTVITADRRRLVMDAKWVREFGPALYLAEASDGVWMPVCDLQPYEASIPPN